MKTRLLILATLTVMCSCEQFDDTALWNSIRDHESRISALETQCRQMNTNIISMQAILDALQNKTYVTNVSPVTEGSANLGYTISFSDGKSVTVYNGRDGKDGENGYVPKIGVRQDADGLWYGCLTTNG